MASVNITAQYRDFIGHVTTVQIGEFPAEDGLKYFDNITGQDLMDNRPFGMSGLDVWGMQVCLQDNNTGIVLRTRQWDRAVDTNADIHPVEQIS